MSMALMPRRRYSGLTIPEATSRVPSRWILTCQTPTMRPLFGYQKPVPVKVARVDAGSANQRLDRVLIGLDRRPDRERHHDSIRSTHCALHSGGGKGSAK